MALRRTLSKRLFTLTNRELSSPITTHEQSPIPSPPQTTIPPNSAGKSTYFHREFFPTPDSSVSTGFFRRFLQRRTINNHSSPNALPSFLTLTMGEKLREKLKSINVSGDHRLRLDGLSPPLPHLSPPPKPAEEVEFGVSVADAKRVLRIVQFEKIKEQLRNIPANTIPFRELVRICGDVCGNRENGLECAKALDESGNVIVLSGIVFLHPDQVAKSMEKLISNSIAMPHDPRRTELELLEKEKAMIDGKAQKLVKREFYCGLGFLVVQTLGFMRLTFWELSWDVMEPICFFVTSLHFALAYGFFLRTSKEPSFEGYFQRRFKVKQSKLMKIHRFDRERYDQLCRAIYSRKCSVEPQDRVLTGTF